MKVVYITGSTGRLGAFLGNGFLKAGYQVVGIDQNATSPSEWPLVEADVTSEKSVISAFEKAVSMVGAPDVVIHTVGMWSMAPIAETTFENWNTHLNLNLSSAFLIFRQAIREMNGQGSLIGISSRQGVVKGAAEQAGYSASKGGLVRLAEAIAEEYRDSGLHTHIVAPSTILFEEGQTGGVSAEDLVAHCLYLATDKGRSLSGTVLSAFGNG